MEGLTGFQEAALAVLAVSVSGVVALIGSWLSRKSEREALWLSNEAQATTHERWRIDFKGLYERWDQDRRDVDRRREEDDQLLARRWSRERTLELLDKGLTRALSPEQLTRDVGFVQLQALSDSSLLQEEEEDLIDRVLLAIVQGRDAGANALRDAEDDGTEILVDEAGDVP